MKAIFNPEKNAMYICSAFTFGNLQKPIDNLGNEISANMRPVNSQEIISSGDRDDPNNNGTVAQFNSKMTELDENLADMDQSFDKWARQ